MSTRHYRPRVSVVVLHGNKILGFNAEDPLSKIKYFFLPGGLIEHGETAFEAAARETLEETGYKVDLIKEIQTQRRYDFEWNGHINDCDTVFIAGKLIEVEPSVPVNDASYHQGVAWISVDDITKVFAYHKDVLEPVEWIVSQLQQ